MKIVIAPDSFKGSLNAIEVSKSIEKGIKKADPEANIVLIPMADGGEGTMETLVASTNGYQKQVTVTGPLGAKVEASYGVLGDSETCVIEMASASGLHLIDSRELNPFKTTTYGVGELIKTALDDGFRKFVIGLGGSATNDGGAGMLQALGMKLLDVNGSEVAHGGGELINIKEVDLSSFDSRIKDSVFIIASDVQNPMIGPQGASHVFGPQKGATSTMVRLLDEGMKNWADQIEKVTDVSLHDRPGAGAAGGIGGAFQAFFPSETRRGIDIVIEYTKLEEVIIDADFVITGEGKIDDQTVFGKTPMGVAQIAQKQNVPTIILAGTVGKGIEQLYQYGVIAVFSIINRPLTLNEAIQGAQELLENTAEQITRLLMKHGK
ncbi:glycerate kinase [Ureibacillus manganicus]|uniref:Glycerate kinase n=1 Tax=Ureibacillus manganicus DSM 26584 TaxID=1384049 RepID=A0A0A3I4N3_9BACL|nr:glycerate kinase [Ureibacillus manganicus]KGR77633.1 glycerate kinase [Ureibacillus manganicus DSM 26584]